MAIVHGLAVLAALSGFVLAFASLGNAVLKFLRFQMERDSEHVLVAIAVGLAVTEALLFLVQFTQHLKWGCLAVIALLCIPLFRESPLVLRRLRAAFPSQALWTGGTRVFLVAIGIILCAEFLVSLAPLTGSDAMHYHFTTQKLILEQGFSPDFSSTHSFLCGQHHLLILLGLALGSEQLALGFIFLGGVLSAAVVAVLASRWACERIILAITLLFLLTPVIFWQMCSSGSPDIFMAFFTGTALLVVSRAADAASWRMALVAGILAGGIAGAKYSGCLIAAAFAVAFLVEFRSLAGFATFFAGCLSSGIWPYLRNMLWTGNPVFPFLSQRLSPRLVTAYALQNLASDTGTGTAHSLAQLFPFLFFGAIRGKSPGFWEFFGPTVFALAPLIFLAFRNTRAWRLPVFVWFLGALGIFFSSGQPRFLLPLFPVALGAVAAAIDWARRNDWRIACRVSAAIVGLMLLAGAAGFAIYGRQPIFASLGLTTREQYLARQAQDYQAAQAINEMLAPESAGKVLVFLRHQYYLRVPCVNGDPGTSFQVDPERLQTPAQWREFLTARGIAYVARGVSYPPAIAAPLAELEKRGELVPVAQRQVGNLQGMRVEQVRNTAPVVLLKVNF